jgi:FdhD protein
MIEQFDIRVYDGEKFSNVPADIIREISIEIVLNNRRIVTIACTGNHLKELAVGFLRAEGIIGTLEDLKKVVVFHEEGRVDIFTKKGDDPPISMKTIPPAAPGGIERMKFP